MCQQRSSATGGAPPLSREQIAAVLGREPSEADVAQINRQRSRERPNTAERVRAAAYVAAGNAHAVAVQGGDPQPLRRRARHLHFKAVRLHVTARILRTTRPRPRTPRPRARARRAARRGKTRAGPGSDDGGSEPEPPEPPPGPLAVARASALAERLSRAEIRLDEQGLNRLRDIGLGGRRLDQAVQILVADGRAEIVRRGAIVCLRLREKGE